MNTLQLAISLVLALVERLSAVSQIIAAATLEHRDDLTVEELRVILASDDKARDALVTALASASAPTIGDKSP